jgi:hypothetical protein
MVVILVHSAFDDEELPAVKKAVPGSRLFREGHPPQLALDLMDELRVGEPTRLLPADDVVGLTRELTSKERWECVFNGRAAEG